MMNSRLLYARVLILFGLATSTGCFYPPTPVTPESTKTAVPPATPTIPLPTPAFIPPYLLDVQPAPSSRISQALYQKADEKIHEGARDVEQWGYRSNICVYFDVAPIIQPGEILLEYDQLVAKTRLFINEVELDPKPDPGFARPDILRWLEVEIEGEEDKEPKQATYGAPYWLCWPAELLTGVHQARFEFEQQTGFIHDYEWIFELTDTDTE